MIITKGLDLHKALAVVTDIISFHVLEWVFFSTNQMAYIQIISVSFFGAVHVSWHFLLCSLEMLDIDLSPCAMTHSLKEAGRAVTSTL